MGRGLGTDHAIGMKPSVVDSHLDQLAEPALRNQLDIGLADTRGYADDELVTAAILQARQGLAVHVQASAPLVADNFVALNADQRRNVAQPPQFARNLIRYKLSVRENLEIAVGMRSEDFEQLRVQERLAAEDAEIGVSVLLRVSEQVIHVLECDLLSRCFHVHPA